LSLVCGVRLCGISRTHRFLPGADDNVIFPWNRYGCISLRHTEVMCHEQGIVCLFHPGFVNNCTMGGCKFRASFPADRLCHCLCSVLPCGSYVRKVGATRNPANEMWKWDWHGWSKLTDMHSPSFAHHTMTFDSGRNVLVVCGRPTPARGGEYQTWEFNGNEWSTAIPGGHTENRPFRDIAHSI
jgi:hypothetical protein